MIKFSKRDDLTIKDLINKAETFAHDRVGRILPFLGEGDQPKVTIKRLQSAASEGQIDPREVEGILQSAATEAVSSSVESGKLSPRKADHAVTLVLKELNKQKRDLENLAFIGNERRILSPVTPSEIAVTGTLGVGIPVLISRLLRKAIGTKPLSLTQSALYWAGPAAVLPMAAFSGVNLLAAPYRDPGFLRGEKSYFSSLGKALKSQADRLDEASQETTKRYGELGSLPIRMFHGVSNPIPTVYRAIRSLYKKVKEIKD